MVEGIKSNAFHLRQTHERSFIPKNLAIVKSIREKDEWPSRENDTVEHKNRFEFFRVNLVVSLIIISSVCRLDKHSNCLRRRHHANIMIYLLFSFMLKLNSAYMFSDLITNHSSWFVSWFFLFLLLSNALWAVLSTCIHKMRCYSGNLYFEHMTHSWHSLHFVDIFSLLILLLLNQWTNGIHSFIHLVRILTVKVIK